MRLADRCGRRSAVTDDRNESEVPVLSDLLARVKRLPAMSPWFGDFPERAGFRQHVAECLGDLEARFTDYWAVLRTLWNVAYPAEDQREWDDDWMPTCFDFPRWKRDFECWLGSRRTLEEALWRMTEAARNMDEEVLHRLLFGDRIPELEGVYWTNLSDLEQDILRVLLPCAGKFTEPQVSQQLGRGPESLKRQLRRLLEIGVLSHKPKSGYWVRARPRGTPGSVFSKES
jgi:hypothetical protein